MNDSGIVSSGTLVLHDDFHLAMVSVSSANDALDTSFELCDVSLNSATAYSFG